MFGGKLLAAIALSMVFAPPSAAEPYGMLPGRSVATTKASMQFARDFGEGISCGLEQEKYDLSTFPKGNDFETVRKIDRLVRQRFVYRSDEGAQDLWMNLAPILTDNLAVTVEGDCEDLAITVMALAICSGVPISSLGLAMLQTTPEGAGIARADHMVGLYRGQGDHLSVFGDTRNRTVLAPTDRVFATITAKGLADTIPKWRVLPAIGGRMNRAVIAPLAERD